MNTNGIKFVGADTEHAKGVGSKPKLTFDDDMTVESIASGSPIAPTHGVLGCSARCRPVECGGVWNQRNRDFGADHFFLTIVSSTSTRTRQSCKSRGWLSVGGDPLGSERDYRSLCASWYSGLPS